MAMPNFTIYSQSANMSLWNGTLTAFSEIKTQVVQWRFIATQYVGIDCAELRGLPNSSITMEQTAEERNLLYLSVSVPRIRQHHSAIKSGMGTVVIPILQIFFHGKTKLIFIGKDNSVQVLQ